MPIYEYECKTCHHQFDVIQKINDAPISQCPQCSNQSVVRLVSAAGFQLKGTGWYVTDFKNNNKAPEPKKEGAASGKESSEGSQSTTDTPSTSKPTTTSGSDEK